MFDLGRSLLASVMRMPDAVAISDGERSMTYQAWQDDILRAVAGLDARGLRQGDHFVTVLQNRYEAATLHMAAQIAGLVITPLNWRASAEELDYVLNDAEAKAVVFEAATAELVDTAIEAINVDDDWDDLLAHPPAAAGSRATVQDKSVMLYTSGTTGRGKGVPRRQGAERAAAMAHVAQNQYARGEVTLGVMPLYHTMGVRSLLASVLINGHFVCQRRYDPREALTLIMDHHITNLYLVPTLYHDLLASPFFTATDTSSVRKLGFAGQAMTDGLLQELDAAFKPELFVNHYGSSEIYTFTIEPNAAAKPGSAGKAGLNQEIRIIDLDANGPDDLVEGPEEGQIIAALDGDESFEGYWKRPDADEKSLHAGWYYTGDIGYRDDDGDIFVTGRVDDMIISGGENILPVEIESVLSLHPGVGEVAVVGLPDPRWGQVVTAFIVRRDGVGEEALDTWCLESELPPFKRPRAYVFIQEVPKSPVGKILRRMLVDGEYTVES
ncbi:MAG: AMP-binding protein [Rhodospirillaceae bacterium]|jgi:2-furoate---CoA ligase|nr:AMP-binding protein [Rhodospirillaceae bacterium]MBT3492579.1 AMP-binding protein [Rhodospirillaceae bacterium]MBT3782448.1 AMP-binding protein [Rhodospirillaceae bacterium]MBT3978969.1 AMP-binding protein [Rhodospirillaceae bacterium]MBT4167378.1 AMP-binding protein [Rhodospirillaceae bacterium]